MFDRLRPRSIYDYAAVLALFIAVSTGSAYAANTVFSTDIVDGQVRTADLANGAVAVTKLADGSITGDKVKDGSIQSRDVLDNNLKGVDIDESTLSSIGGGGPAGGDLSGAYPNPEIDWETIGALNLKDIIQVNDSELIPPGGVDNDVRAECPHQTTAIGGGGYWEFPSGQLSGFRNYGGGVIAEGTNKGGAEQRLIAFAYCLEP